MKPQSRKSLHSLVVGLALGLLTLALFSPALTHDFLGYDDQQYITENSHVQAGLTWPAVAWAFRSLYASNWHPLTWLSHMLDCQLYGLKPAGHHLTNILFHAANVFLLFWVLNRMTGALWRSACVAALFAWHPLHVESVAWIAERKDVLSAFFFLLTLLAYERYVSRVEGRGAMENPKSETRGPKEARNSKAESLTTKEPEYTRRHGFRVFRVFRGPTLCWYWATLLLFSCALMSKPMAVTLPFVLLLLDYWPLKRGTSGGYRVAGDPNPERAGAWLQPKVIRRLLVEKLPFLALSAGCCALTLAAQRQGYSIVSVASLPLSRRIPHAIVACVHYLGAMILPRHLSAQYAYPPATLAGQALGAGVVLALLSLLAFRWRSRRPYLAMGWLWYPGMLVPVIGLVQVGDQAWADRYTYLPLIGVFIAIVWGAGDFAREKLAGGAGPKGAGGRAVLCGLAGAVGIGLLTASTLQLRYWRNTRTLFEHAVQVAPDDSRAITVLGTLLAEEGELEEAKRLFLLALRYKPDDPEAHFHLGKALDQQGQLDEAIAEYNRALWFKPLQGKTHFLLGAALAKQQKNEEAAAHYQAALALNPDSAAAQNNLARVLHTQGRLDEAIEHYAAALQLDPKLARARNNLGVLLLQKGRVAEGAAQLGEAVRLAPNDYEFQCNLATALNEQEKWKESAAIYARLAPGSPNDANLHCQFALALAHLQKTREAMSHYAHALVLRPDFPEALNGLAWILSTAPEAELRNGTQAVPMAELACELTAQKQPGMLLTLAAAYAEAGRFQDGISTAQKAQSGALGTSQQELAAKCQALLESVKAGKPWREAPLCPGSK